MSAPAPPPERPRLGRLIYPHARPLLLASASPRRAELLRTAGIPFEVAAADVDESLPPGADPKGSAERLARAKATAARARHDGRWILAADTIVDLERRILGKPAEAGQAREMLQLLSGRAHEVHTGVAVVDPDGLLRSAVATTRVVFRPLTWPEIEAYVDGGEPFDKAGGYAIQGEGGLLIERIEGPWDNVVGLPLGVVRQLLAGEPTA